MRKRSRLAILIVMVGLLALSFCVVVLKQRSATLHRENVTGVNETRHQAQGVSGAKKINERLHGGRKENTSDNDFPKNEGVITNLVAIRPGADIPEDQIRQSQENLRYSSSSITDADPKECRFGEILNEELEKYYSGKDSSVSVTDVSDTENLSHIHQAWLNMWERAGAQSVVEIDLSSYGEELVFDLEFFNSQELLNYYRSAVGEYANLAPFLDCNYVEYASESDGKGMMKKIVLPTHVEKKQLPETVAMYKKELEMLTDIPAGLTPEEKVLHLYQAIAVYTGYTTNLASSDDQYRWHTGLGVMLDHDSVCQGYAVVFNQAASMLGLDSEQLYSSGDGFTGHTWNAVKIASKWYQVDVTWGDTASADPVLDSVDYTYLFFDDLAVSSEDIFHSATLCTDKFKEIISGQGSAFEQFLPKNAKISKPFVYLEGAWYYTDGYDLYRWIYQRGEKDETSRIASLSETGYASVAVYDGKLWFSDMGYGLGTYDLETGTAIPYLEEIMTSMVIRGDVAYYNDYGGAVKTFPLKGAEPLDEYKKPEYPDYISILTAPEDMLVSNNAVHDSRDEAGAYAYDGYIQSVNSSVLLPEYAFFVISFQVKGVLKDNEKIFEVMPYNTEWGGWDSTSFTCSAASFREETGEYLLKIDVSDIKQSLSSGVLLGININFCETSAVVGVTGIYLTKASMDAGMLPQGNQLDLPDVLQDSVTDQKYLQKNILNVDEADRDSGADSRVKNLEGGEYNGYLQTVYKDNLSPDYPYLKVTYQVTGQADEKKEIFVIQPFNMNWGGWELNTITIQDSFFDQEKGEYIAYMPVKTIRESLKEGELYGINLGFWSAEPAVRLTGYYMVSAIPKEHEVKTDQMEDGSGLVRLKDGAEYQLSEKNLLTGITFRKNKVEDVCSWFTDGGLVCRDEKGTLLSASDTLMTGASVNIKDGSEERLACIIVIAGDVFGDGVLNLKDVTLTAQYCLNKRTLTEAQLAAADVVADGEVNLKDVTMLARSNLNKAALPSQR